jgi:hypothetical protein
LFGIIATLLTYFLANTKNGFAISALIFVYFFTQAFGANSKVRIRRSGLYFVLLACVLIFGYTLKKHTDNNPAWANLIADYKTSIQINQHDNWKDNASPLPINEHGYTVNLSTYERVSWAKAGLELLSEHPWGYGLIDHSFGAMAIQKWEKFRNNQASTHSGWLDFALGFGIFGLMLVVIPIVVSYARLRKRSGFWNTYALWSIPVITFTYTTTEVCTGHFIELLFFMAAWFSGLALRDAPSTIAAGGG